MPGDNDALRRLAALIRQRNEAEIEITRIIGRPAQLGHIGECIASVVFRITLTPTAVERGIDGHFAGGPLAGRSVNVKWYPRHEGFLDIEPRWVPDYYLVLTGSRDPPTSSKGLPRPWLIRSVFLFEGPRLIDSLRGLGVKIGVATSVRSDLWDTAEIYPTQRNHLLVTSDEQRALLALFG